MDTDSVGSIGDVAEPLERTSAVGMLILCHGCATPVSMRIGSGPHLALTSRPAAMIFVSVGSVLWISRDSERRSARRFGWQEPREGRTDVSCMEIECSPRPGVRERHRDGGVAMPRRGVSLRQRPYIGRYRPLIQCLERSQEASVTMRFTEIEAVIGSSLCARAKQSRSNWHSRHCAHVRAWQQMGWRVRVDRAGERVMWTRGEEPEIYGV